MCGIAGIYAYGACAPPVQESELLRVRDDMYQRGPDSSGLWLADRTIGLAFRRLSILDLSDNAAQPMTSASGRHVICFNGEIYNYRPLRALLEAKGHKFRSTGDTEVLLALYEEHGTDMLAHLRGMFAIAIWDKQRRRLFLARDPYGIKPLYYSDDGQTFRFASQLRALVAGRSVPTALDPAGAAGFLLTGSVPEPNTIFKAVRCLRAGEYLIVDTTGQQPPRPYYSLAQVLHDANHGTRVNGHDLAEMVHDAFADSIKHHQISDVPVGVFLSAGIDSGSIVALMHETGSGQVTTITAAFDEYENTRHDEATPAKAVADLFATDHRPVHVTRGDFEACLPNILAAMDQPSIDGVNTWFVSKAAHEAGLKVCISGLGADELFGGYPSFVDVPRWAGPDWVPKLAGLRQSLAPTLAGYAHALRLSVHPKAFGLFAYAGTWPGAWFVRRGLFMPWELPMYLGKEVATEGLAQLNLLDRAAEVLTPEPATDFGRVMLLESSFYMRNQLLRDADWAGMAHSLEIRLPFVDCRLFETLAAPLAAKPGSKKRYIADALRIRLPDQVLSRKKTGFVVPIERWTAAASMRRFIPRAKPPGGHWSRNWALTVLNQFVPDALLQ